MESAQLERCIEAIYDASLLPHGWSAALSELSKLFNASFSDVCSWTADRLHVSGTAIGLDTDDYNDKLLGFWFNRNVWGQKSPVRLAGEVISTRQMVPREELRRSEMYNEYLKPRGLHEGMRISLWVEPDSLADLSLLRPWSLGAFGPAEVELGRRLLPHLRRAATITRHLHHAQFRWGPNGPGTALGRVGVVAFDREGAPLSHNEVAEAMLMPANGLWLDAASLRATSPDVTRRLALAIFRAIGRDGALRTASAVQVPWSSDLTLTVMVQPMSDRQDWSMPRPPAAVAMFQDPTPTLSPKFLQRMFGLTAMEARLALDLAAGLTLRNVAARTGRSPNTVRAHLASVMDKTETTRQVDLVRLLHQVGGMDPSHWAAPFSPILHVNKR